MRSCDEILELLSAALDGQLTAGEQAELDEHLSGCPACSALFADLSALQAASAELEDLPAPDGFAARVMDSIAADPTQERSGNVTPFPARKVSHWKRWAASAAVVVIAALGAFSLSGLPGGGRNADQTAAGGYGETGSAAPSSMMETAEAAIENTMDTATEGAVSDSAPANQQNIEFSTSDFILASDHADARGCPAPGFTQDEQCAARAQELLADMTLHEKVCQLFIVSPEAITGVSAVTSAGETTRQALADWPVGGFIYNKQNMHTREQVTDMLTMVQTMSRIPLILTCDEEGGRVNRLMSSVGTTWVGPMLDYRDEGTETAFDNAQTIASDLLSCGFNLDLAPVADVWSNPDNTVIGDRAYSDDFQQAAQLVAAAVEGFRAGGVACTLKHFPGHGDTSADSHYGSVYVYKTLDELRQNELIPFQAGIDAGADAVMIGHLIVPDLDSEPAPFSYRIVTELLRQEMGFDGVVMTDGLQMQAITDHYDSAEIAVKAIQAGVDILLCPPDLEAAVTALKEAVAAGTIAEARIDESVLRILELKLKQRMLT